MKCKISLALTILCAIAFVPVYSFSAKGDTSNSFNAISTPLAFTTSTQFQIPITNSTINFAQNGYYLNAILFNDTWVFENLQLNQPNEGVLSDSPNTANLNITSNTNVTITSFERLLTPNTGDINNTGSWLTSGWLNYSVTGVGKQIVNMKFNLANWTTPSQSDFANGSISSWPITVHVYIDGKETVWGSGNGLLPYSAGDNTIIPYGTGVIVNGANSNVSIQYAWAPVPISQSTSSSSQASNSLSNLPSSYNTQLIVIGVLVAVIVISTVILLRLQRRLNTKTSSLPSFFKLKKPTKAR
jgi:hypothetical protein